MKCIARRRARRNVAGIAILLTTLAPGARPLLAQDEPPARRPAGQPVSIAGTLAAVLDKIVWDPSKSGVLLIVAPERTRPQSANPLANLISLAEEPDRTLPDALKPPPLPPPGAAGYRLDALAPVLRRRLVKEGAVSTLAPVDVAKPQADPMQGVDVAEMAEMFGGLDAEPNALRLLATLTPGQWSALLSAQGLGREQCDRSQQQIWDALIPMQTTFWYPKGTAPQKAKEPNPEDFLKALAGSVPPEQVFREMLPPPMDPALVGTLRLQLRKDLTAVAMSRDDGKGDSGYPLQVPVDETKWDSSETFLRPVPTAMLNAGLGFLSRQMSERQPALPKKSDANYGASALQAPVPLGDVKTIGALVDRIAKTSGVALVCDRRIADLTVHLRGESALAGDLLKALTRALHGTVRRLGDGDDKVFLLTEDIVPAARRDGGRMQGFLGAMAPMQKRMMERTREGKRARAVVASREPLAKAPRGDGQELPETLWRGAETGDPKATVPLAQMPDRWQKVARDFWNEMDEEIRSTQHAPDQARGNLALGLRAVLPSVGAWTTLVSIDAADLRPDANQDVPVEPLTWAAGNPVRGARTAMPSTLEAARAILGTLKERGFTHWVLDLPTLGRLPGLGTLASEIQLMGLKWVPVLSPLHGEASFPDVPRDISLSGETARQWAMSKPAREMRTALPIYAAAIDRVAKSDYLVPEAVDPLAVARAVEQIASLPAVEAIVLDDLAPEGYSGASMGDMLWSGGGTLGARIRFVRSEAVDPADLSAGMPDFLPGAETSMFFPSRADFAWRDKWNKDMAKRRDALFARLDTAIGRSRIPVPVLMSVGTSWSDSMWEPWTGKFRSVFDDTQLALQRQEEGQATAKSGASKQAKPRIRWMTIDTAQFGSAADGLGMDSDINDPHLLRPFEERLAAWIGGKLEGAFGSSKEKPDAATAADDSDATTGFVLDMSHVSPEEAMGFLIRRVVKQSAPSTDKPPVAPSSPPGTAAKPEKTEPAATPTTVSNPLSTGRAPSVKKQKPTAGSTRKPSTRRKR